MTSAETNTAQRDLIRAKRDKPPFVLIATLFAFIVSGFFVSTTIFDAIGARSDTSEINTFRSATETTDADVAFQHDATINFTDDAIIGLVFFLVSAVITAICLFAYNRSYHYLSLSADGKSLLLRKRAKSKPLRVGIGEVTSVVVDDADFDDALAQKADPRRTAACDLIINAKTKRFLIHTESRSLAESAHSELSTLIA